MRRLATACAAIAAAAALAFAPVAGAQVAPPPYVVAAAWGQSVGYVNHVVVLPQGSSLSLLVADFPHAHDVVSDDPGPDDNNWCGPYPAGTCPLFWSPLVNSLPPGPSAVVRGVEALAPGTYTFHCTIHGDMDDGVLVIV